MAHNEKNPLAILPGQYLCQQLNNEALKLPVYVTPGSKFQVPLLRPPIGLPIRSYGAISWFRFYGVEKNPSGILTDTFAVETATHKKKR